MIEEKTDMALLNLDAAVRIQPDLADAYLVRTQIYTTASDFANAMRDGLPEWKNLCPVGMEDKNII